MKYKHEDLVAEYNGKYSVLNAKLLKRQKIEDPKTIKALVDSHIEKLKVFEAMDSTESPAILHKLAYDVQSIEFKLQKLWGFPKNSDYHYWWKVPKCTCPIMDNQDNYGTQYRNVDMNCPVHGQLGDKEIKKPKRTFWSKWF